MVKPLTTEGLFTPVNEDVAALIIEMREATGGTWRTLTAATGVKGRMCRRLITAHRGLGIGHKNKRAVISIGVMDRLITGTGVGSLDDFEWFTHFDLIRLGIWNEGLLRKTGRIPTHSPIVLPEIEDE